MLHLIILCGRAVLYRFGVQRDIREKKRKEERKGKTVQVPLRPTVRALSRHET
jgi:hypothetical protein